MRADTPVCLYVICRVERKSLVRVEFKDRSIREREERGMSGSRILPMILMS